jgi:hypothetical protein
VLTIFSCPKPFQGAAERAQRNAIYSWLALRDNVQVILVGQEAGVAGVAAELGVDHVPDVERNDLGTPLISSIFSLAEAHSRHDIMVYLNADIMLLPDFLDAVKQCERLGKYFLVGKRWDLSVERDLDLRNAEDSSWIRDALEKSGKLGGLAYLDYFVFEKGSLGKLPPFAVGRPAWDNWLLYHADVSGLKVIDITDAVRVVHQSHGYAHVKQASGDRWEGPEADENRRLANGGRFDLLDCCYRLGEDGLAKTRDAERVWHRVSRMREERPTLWRLLVSWKLRYAVSYLWPEWSTGIGRKAS